MSALKQLPEHVQDEIRRTPANIRADLRLIEFAEKLGYTVEFRNNNWSNSALFHLGDTCVWLARHRWQAKDVIDGRYEKNARLYGCNYTGLWNALVTEALRNAFKF